MATVPVAVVIPAYKPDDALLVLCRKLVELGITDIIIVDDGSGKEYENIFRNAKENYHCTVLKHAANLGKGRALKDAFNYLLTKETFCGIGCVTVDSDGQHDVSDIKRCMKALEENPQELILGCRDFDSSNVPFKSRFGNKLTRNVCKWLCGLDVSDTQTGLRAVSIDFMRHLLNTPGERFEFETNMLMESRNRLEIKEISIKTIYDSKEEHATHFDPIWDSIKIYKIFGREFLKFLLSSLSSGILDLCLFSLFCELFKMITPLWYIAVSTVCARIVSASYNYLINYKIVFCSKTRHHVSYVKYFFLAVIQMSMSAFFVTACVNIFIPFPEVAIKMIVDTLLFFLSYKIQQKYIFRE